MCALLPAVSLLLALEDYRRPVVFAACLLACLRLRDGELERASARRLLCVHYYTGRACVRE